VGFAYFLWDRTVITVKLNTTNAPSPIADALFWKQVFIITPPVLSLLKPIYQLLRFATK
jgi:hypothetical protein